MISDEKKPVSWKFFFFLSFLDFFIAIFGLFAIFSKFLFFFDFLRPWRWNLKQQSLNSDAKANAGKDADDGRDCEH